MTEAAKHTPQERVAKWLADYDHNAAVDHEAGDPTDDGLAEFSCNDIRAVLAAFEAQERLVETLTAALDRMVNERIAPGAFLFAAAMPHDMRVQGASALAAAKEK